ncbi:hypothetical protein C8R43DRAFT_1049182 [Mycena crocata]|nr:hypothetical protein C8R43DRAFT_1049182 [Mycena crocata]
MGGPIFFFFLVTPHAPHFSRRTAKSTSRGQIRRCASRTRALRLPSSSSARMSAVVFGCLCVMASANPLIASFCLTYLAAWRAARRIRRITMRRRKSSTIAMRSSMILGSSGGGGGGAGGRGSCAATANGTVKPSNVMMRAKSGNSSSRT